MATVIGLMVLWALALAYVGSWFVTQRDRVHVEATWGRYAHTNARRPRQSLASRQTRYRASW